MITGREVYLAYVNAKQVKVPAHVSHSRKGRAFRVREYTYLAKDHATFAKQVGVWKRELKKIARGMTLEEKLKNLILPAYDPKTGKDAGQPLIGAVKKVADSIRGKDPTTAEWLDNVHGNLTDRSGNFDRYGDAGSAHGYLRMAERGMKGVTFRLPPALVAWIKLHKAKGFTDESFGDED